MIARRTPDENDALRREVAAIPYWFHRIDLGDGIVTPGIDDSAAKLQRLALPPRLDGLGVLDVGTFNGFFAFEAERRGAQVLAIDSQAWELPGLYAKQGFDLCRRALRSGVADRQLDVYYLTPQSAGQFDVVLFLGVLYHLRYPLLALERVASVTRRLLVMETHVDGLSFDRPAMMFYPGAELSGDPSNWWGPNPAAIVAMLRDVGFPEIEQVGIWGDRAVFHARKAI